MTTRRRTLVAAGIALALTAAALVPLQAGAGATPRARAQLIDAGFRPVGTVLFVPVPGGKTRVTYAIHATALSAGLYGFHVHTVGVCDPRQQALPGTSAFAGAGSHFKGSGANHGSHDGDMPPVLIMADGRASGTFVTDRLDLAELIDRPDGAPTGGDGSAVMLHARADNLGNIPTRYSTSSGAGPDAATLGTGDAGDRFACGQISRI